MKSWMRVLPLILVMLLAVQVNDAFAQYGKKKKKKRPEKKEQVEKSTKERTARMGGEFVDRLWYGGGFNLGFSGNSVVSVFNIGITPMVGYKITERFSAGPRVGINYTYYKGPGTDGRIKKVQPISYEYGVFTRFKFLPILFAHLEGGFKNEEFVLTDRFGQIGVDPATGDPLTERQNNPTIAFGLGYTSDASPGYEILLLYDFLFPDDDPGLPFDLRIGFNWRF